MVSIFAYSTCLYISFLFQGGVGPFTPCKEREPEDLNESQGERAEVKKTKTRIYINSARKSNPTPPAAFDRKDTKLNYYTGRKNHREIRREELYKRYYPQEVMSSSLCYRCNRPGNKLMMPNVAILYWYYYRNSNF